MNSKIQFGKIPMSVAERKNTSADSEISIFLDVSNGTGLEHYFCLVAINGKPYRQLRCDSILTIFIPVPIKSICFSISKQTGPANQMNDTSDALETDLYTPKNPEVGSRMIFNIQADEAYYYKPFIARQVKLKRNRLWIDDVKTQQGYQLTRVTAREGFKFSKLNPGNIQ